jgi:hypothetical protein
MTGLIITGNISSGAAAGGISGEVSLGVLGGNISFSAGSTVSATRLDLISYNGNFGTAQAPVSANVGFLDVLTGGNGSAFLTTSGSNTNLELAAAGSSGTFLLSSSANLLAQVPIIANSISISTSASASFGTYGIPVQTIASSLSATSNAPSNFYFANLGPLNLTGTNVPQMLKEICLLPRQQT